MPAQHPTRKPHHANPSQHVPDRRDRPPLWRTPRSLALSAITGLTFLSYFLTLGSLPRYATDLGISSGAAGLTITAMLAGTLLAQALAPSLLRRTGKTALLAAALVLLGAPAPLHLLHPHPQLAWVLALCAVRGIGFGLTGVITALFAASNAPHGRQAESLALYGLAITVPGVFAVSAGVALTTDGHFEVVALLAACPLLGLLFLSRLGPCHPTTPPGQQHHPARRTVLRAITPPTTVLLVTALAGGGVTSYLPIARPTGYLATVALLIYGAGQSWARWKAADLAPRHPRRHVLLVAVTSVALGLAVLAAALTVASGLAATTLCLAAVAGFGIGSGAVQNLTLLWAFEAAGPQAATIGSAAWNAAFTAGTATGSTLVGLLSTTIGIPGALAITALLVAASTPLARQQPPPA